MTNKTITLSREAILLVAREMDRLGYGHHESHAESLLYAALEADPVPPAGDWGIDTTAGRPILVYQGCSVIEAEQAYYVLGLINGTVPPAGGEPEVLAWIDRSTDSGVILTLTGEKSSVDNIGLVDRAHVTRLKAEVERWKANNMANARAAGELVKILRDQRDALKAEVERLGKRVEEEVATAISNELKSERDVLALQSELTKARELLRDINDAPGGSSFRKHIEALLSNQSAPADKGEECVHDFRMFSGECHKCGADWIPGKEYAPAEKGEPVAFPGYPPVPEDRKLPADQPAPVAVSLPERKTVKAGLLSESNTHNQGWNACLDEFARLNSEPKP